MSKPTAYKGKNTLSKLVSWAMLIAMSFNSLAYAKPAENYFIFYTGNTLTDYSLTISGTATATPYVGQFSQQDVYVDWGDGTTDLTSDLSFVDTNGNLSGSWSNSHTYAGPGTYNVTVELYHQNPQGAEASAAATVIIPFVIPPAGNLTVINTVINDNGGTAVSGNFNISVTGTNVSPSSFAGTESGTAVSVDPGAFGVSSSSVSGYTTTYSADCNGTIASNETKTCTITQDDIAPTTGTLTVINNVTNDNGGAAVSGNFTMTVTGTSVSNGSFAGSTGGTIVTLDAGSFNVSSSSVFGYATSYSTDCTGTIAAGENKTCTVTQDDIAPKLTVTKVVSNTNGGGTLGVSDFPLFVDGNSVTSGVENSFDAGTYNVTETNSKGYTGVFTGGCTSTGLVTLNVGDVKSCTLTNYDSPPPGTLTVIKTVVDQYLGGLLSNNFTINVNSNGQLFTSFAGSETGVTISLAAGSYEVSEDETPGYTPTMSDDCSGNIEDGDTKTCTITNTAVPAKLTVTKVVVNDNGGVKQVSDFPLFVDETSVVSGVENNYSAGTYTVSETSSSGYAATFSGDCNAQGQVTLALGEVKTCTITNNDIAAGGGGGGENETATLTVVKHVINNNGGTKTAANFTMNVTGTSVSSTSFAGSETGTVVTLAAGSYSVNEATFTGNYNKSIGTDCSGTIAAGESKTCTITNDDFTIGGGGGGGGGGAGGSAAFGKPASSGGEVLGVQAPVVTPINPLLPAEGQVLGEQACSIYIKSFIHIDRQNDADDVKRLQTFLNEYMGSGLQVSGFYDTTSYRAVKQFQTKEFDEVLKPWNITQPTGYVYLTTRRRINMIKCPSLNLPMPELKLGLTN